MMSRNQKAPPKQRLVYEGPTGFCPCCNKPTEVRLGGTLGEPDVSEWIVPERVLERIYRAVSVRIRERNGTLYVTDPSEYDATRRAKLFFVDGDDGIAGPFGQLGLKVFLGAHFGEEHIGNVRVYVVTTTHRALDLIRKSPYARPPEDNGGLDVSADLF